MDELYREHILDHYKHPRNFGVLDHANASSSDNLVSCGDELSMRLLIDKKTNVIKDVKFTGHGCAISMASASMLTEEIKGKSIAIVAKYDKDTVLRLLGITLTPTRLKCALLSLEIVTKALRNV